MKIGDYEFPDELYYDKEHNWVRVEGNVVTQGLSDLGQALAGEIVYVETPRVGREVKRGDAILSLESGKWVGRVKAMLSGKIVAANEDLEFESTLLNESPYDRGWLVKIEAADLGELDALFRISDPEYQAFIAAEREKHGK